MNMKIVIEKQKSSFLQQVADSIFANPFTRARHLSDCSLTGLPEKTDPHTVLKTAIDRVNHDVQSVVRENKATLSAYRACDRQSMANLFLFYLFHKYMARFDNHIRKQEQTDQSLPMDFGKDLAAELKFFGFSEQESDRYIALFFQMRRAFYFIKKSLIGTSPGMEKMRAHLWQTIFTHDIIEYAQNLVGRLEDFSTLILGETGTGKGLAATAIGKSAFIPYNGKTGRFAISFTQAFLSINLCQYAEQLIESELFGHARGAFTGAVTDHPGIFARSSRHGAVFLDEIGEVSIHTQIKLLRILQERVFTPVGSHAGLRFEGRLIGATNQNIEELTGQGKFREDFYFRLCTDSITIPTLRERISEHPGELEQLAVHLLDRITGGSTAKMRNTVLSVLNRPGNRAYTWPGNVRELEQAIRRILLHGTCNLINRAGKADNLADLLLHEQPTMAKLNSHYCRILFGRHGTMQAVARITGLDRRTVKKYIEQGAGKR